MSSPTSDLGHPILDVSLDRAALPRGLTAVPNVVRLAFAALIALAIFPPFVPLAGPFSLDDLFPLLAVAIGLPTLLMHRRPANFDATVLAFGFFILVALISSAANAVHIADYLRLAGRSAGRMAFYLALILSTRAVLGDRSWARHALVVFVAAASVEAVFCIYAYATDYSGPYGMGVTGFAHWSVLKGRTRLQGTFSGQAREFEVVVTSANFLAAYLVMAIPIATGLAIVTKRRAFRFLFLATALLQTAVLYLTYTRAAMIALGCAILAFGWLLGRRRLAALVLICGVCGAMAVPSIRTKFLHEKHDRFALYYAAASIVVDNPMTGVGDGNYMNVLTKHQPYYWNELGSASTTSHNSVLLSAAHHGVLGGLAHALLYLLILLACVHAVGRSKGRARTLTAAVAAALVGYLAQDQFNDLAYVPKVATQAWFLFGLLWVMPKAFDSEPPAGDVARMNDDVADQKQGVAPGLRRVGNG